MFIDDEILFRDGAMLRRRYDRQSSSQWRQAVLLDKHKNLSRIENGQSVMVPIGDTDTRRHSDLVLATVAGSCRQTMTAREQSRKPRACCMQVCDSGRDIAVARADEESDLAQAMPMDVISSNAPCRRFSCSKWLCSRWCLRSL
jgi:hypothetical protein